MADGVIYLDVDDEITSAAARIRAVEGSRVAVVLPYGSRVATSRINFRLLSRDALTHEQAAVDHRGRPGDAGARRVGRPAGLRLGRGVRGRSDEAPRPRAGAASAAAGAGRGPPTTATAARMPVGRGDGRRSRRGCRDRAACRLEPWPATTARRRRSRRRPAGSAARPRPAAPDAPAAGHRRRDGSAAARPRRRLRGPVRSRGGPAARSRPESVDDSWRRDRPARARPRSSAERVAPTRRRGRRPRIDRSPRSRTGCRSSSVPRVLALALLVGGVGAYLVLPAASVVVTPRRDVVGPDRHDRSRGPGRDGAGPSADPKVVPAEVDAGRRRGDATRSRRPASASRRPRRPARSGSGTRTSRRRTRSRRAASSARRPASASGPTRPITVPRADLVGLQIFPTTATVKVTAVEGRHRRQRRAEHDPSSSPAARTRSRSTSTTPTPRAVASATSSPGDPGGRRQGDGGARRPQLDDGFADEARRPAPSRRPAPRCSRRPPCSARPPRPSTRPPPRGQEVATFDLGGERERHRASPSTKRPSRSSPPRTSRSHVEPGSLGSSTDRAASTRRPASSRAASSRSRSTVTAKEIADRSIRTAIEAEILGKSLAEAQTDPRPLRDGPALGLARLGRDGPDARCARRRAVGRRQFGAGAMSAILGVDLGERRIGVAIADGRRCRRAATDHAAPRTRTSRPTPRPARQLIEAHEVDELVVGLPLDAAGHEGPQAVATRAWADAVVARSAVSPVISFRDERLTSHVAETRLGPMPRGRSGGPPSRHQRDAYRARVDREAAAIILQDELDSRAAARDGSAQIRTQQSLETQAMTIRSGGRPRDPRSQHARRFEPDAYATDYVPEGFEPSRRAMGGNGGGGATGGAAGAASSGIAQVPGLRAPAGGPRAARGADRPSPARQQRDPRLGGRQPGRAAMPFVADIVREDLGAP